jgi:hypothetical protein
MPGELDRSIIDGPRHFRVRRMLMSDAKKLRAKTDAKLRVEYGMHEYGF